MRDSPTTQYHLKCIYSMSVPHLSSQLKALLLTLISPVDILIKIVILQFDEKLHNMNGRPITNSKSCCLKRWTLFYLNDKANSNGHFHSIFKTKVYVIMQHR